MRLLSVRHSFTILPINSLAMILTIILKPFLRFYPTNTDIAIMRIDSVGKMFMGMLWLRLLLLFADLCHAQDPIPNMREQAPNTVKIDLNRP